MRSDPKQPFATAAQPPARTLERDPKKLRLLKVTAPIAALVAAFGLWLTGLFLWTTSSNRDFSADRVQAAAAGFERQVAATGLFPEPWLSQYNLGTARLVQGRVEEGVALLHRSFDGVPKAVRSEQGTIQPFAYECSVRMNLSAGIEMQGDALAAAGDEDQAAEMYLSALEWVTPCEAGGGGGESDETAGQGGNEPGEGDSPSGGEPGAEQGSGGDPQQGNEAGDRLREKLGQTQPGQSDGEGEGGQQGGEDGQDGSGAGSGQGSDPFEGETPEQRERREELQQRNQQQAEREREKDESIHRGPGGGW